MSGAALHPAGAALANGTIPASAWLPVRAGGVDWSVESGCVAELLGADGLHWTDWERSGAVEIVKSGPHRTVYRLSLLSGDYYLKHFRIADWQAALRNLVRPSPAERELQAVRRLAALRFPTFEPVAFGRKKSSGLTWDTYLVSRAIPDSLPLDHFILTDFRGYPRQRQAELRQRIAGEVGQLAARLHRYGIEHVDLHAGNLMIQPAAGPDVPLLSLIDLHAVRFRGHLSRNRRDKNLGAVHQFFAGRSTRADRRRFLGAYQHTLQNSSEIRTSVNVPRNAEAEEGAAPVRRETGRRNATFSAECDRLEHMLELAAETGWRRADRAWRRGNRHVRRLDAGSLRCRGLATLDVPQLTALRDNPERPFEVHRVRWCKRSPRRRVAEVRLPLFGAEAPLVRAFWKCIVERSILARLLGRWRLSPVRRAWEMGHALLRRGINTPRPLLCLEATDDSKVRQYLLTEAIEGSHTLTESFDRHWPTLTDRRRSEWLRPRMKNLARSVRRMHDAGFDHRDLKFPNLLVAADSADNRVWVLDLDAVQQWGTLPVRRAQQNLSRLNVSALLVRGIRHTDRLRFLRWYLGSCFSSEWKSWWRAVSRRSLQKFARNRRLLRPLS